MKGNVKLMLTVTAGVAIGLFIVRRINTRQMQTKVAEEGYETAHDILYPRYLKRGKNVRYGPVLPQD